MSIRLNAVALSIVLATGSVAVNASPGGVGASTEATQILNNIQLGLGVTQQTKAAVELVASTIMHTRNWKQLLLSNLPLGMGAVMATVGDLGREVNEFQKYQQSLQQAGSSLEQLKSSFDIRMVQSNLQGVSFTDYVKMEAARIASGDKQAKQRLDTERSIIERANADLSAAIANSGSYSAAVGAVEGIGMMNAQMNQLVQQNARLASIMANAAGSEQFYQREKDLAIRADGLGTSTQLQSITQKRTEDQLKAIELIKAK